MWNSKIQDKNIHDGWDDTSKSCDSLFYNEIFFYSLLTLKSLFFADGYIHIDWYIEIAL